MIVKRIEEIREAGDVPYKRLCAWGRVPYDPFMRWRKRMQKGEEPVLFPGPKKVEPPDFAKLHLEIQTLKHRRKRTEGTGDLYQSYRSQISRRDLGDLVVEERRRQIKERREAYSQVIWRVPRLVWAIDDTEHRVDVALPKAYLNTVQDLGSRHKFEPLVGCHLAHGNQVADHLRSLFDMYGPPLFLKRDNGGNLNHGDVEKLLEKYMVIPINSPCYYPQYNGGIEVAQREIKDRLKDPVPYQLLAAQVRIEVQALNLEPRPCLGLRSPCEVFRSGKNFASSFTKRKRREVYEEIRLKTLKIIEKGDYSKDVAWRIAVERWLLENRFIYVHNRNGVLPSSSCSILRN
jgi:hypothetical protein